VRVAVADVDSHIIEPADLWTSRISSKWGDLVPHVKFHERRQEDYWYIGDKKLYGAGAFAQARWPEYPPSHPKKLSEAFLPAVDAKARLAYNDEVGVYYQVLYPNILGFHSHVFLNNMPHELATECVQAYNDWLVEWASADSRRLIPMMMLPFWDIDASVAEMKRAYDIGHKGVLFAARYDKVGLPRLVDDYWEPLLGQAQEMGLSMNFHVGFLSSGEDLKGQIYGMYWFEQESVGRVIGEMEDNLMFETDFPHATSLSPGPASESPSPRDVVQRSLGNLSDEVAGKVLQHTATKLYKLEPPVAG